MSCYCFRTIGPSPCSITFSVPVQSPDNTFFGEMYMCTVQLSEILKLCLWKWDCDREFAITIRMNERKQTQSLSLPCSHGCDVPLIPMSMIWHVRHAKEVWQRRSRPTSRHSFITMQCTCGEATLCIRQATFFNFEGKLHKVR